jgi:hypothetical protein
VVRLIRSKGVGVYFVTQNPLDVPHTVSSQLGNRVHHALRAFTPMEQKAVKAAATIFRANPAFDTEKAIMELGVGEALVSTLDPKRQPTIVQRTLIHPPNSRVGPVTDAERKAIITSSPVAGIYDEVEDGESAYEILKKRAADRTDAEASAQSDQPAAKKSGGGSRSDGFWTTFGKQIIRSVVPAATRMAERAIKDGVAGAIKRGTFGGIKRGGNFTGYSLKPLERETDK